MIEDKKLAEIIGLKRKCGYWEVNNKYFFDIFEWLRYASVNKIYDVKYYDSVYTTLDWSKEPTETLDEMYKDRALQLRDEYDYLILSFSGGSDCNNILRSFIDNNINLINKEWAETLFKLVPKCLQILNTILEYLFSFEYSQQEFLLKKILAFPLCN